MVETSSVDRLEGYLQCLQPFQLNYVYIKTKWEGWTDDIGTRDENCFIGFCFNHGL